MSYSCNQPAVLPLPFGRGEGRGEGSLRVAYDTVYPL